jgi:hypothetical protein
MPAQHRRTYGAIYQMALASAFSVLPLIGPLLAGNADAFPGWRGPAGLPSLSCRRRSF